MHERKFRGLTFWAAFALVVCVGAVFVSGAGARSAVVGISACNQDLQANTSYVVLSDMTCTNGNGFKVRGNNVSLNLNGKTVKLAFSAGHDYSDGVDNTGGWSNLTVWGGTLSGWCTGIDNISDGVMVHGMFKNLTINLSKGPAATYDPCDNTWGIYGYALHNSTISNVTVNNPDGTSPDAYGVELDCGAYNKVVNSWMNMFQSGPPTDTFGVILSDGCSSGAPPRAVKGVTTVHANAHPLAPRAAHWLPAGFKAPQPGTTCTGETGTLVNGVTVNQANSDAFVDSCGTGNTFSYNVSQGQFGDTIGFYLNATLLDVLKNNQAFTGYEGYVFDYNGALYTSANLANGNDEDGFYLEDNGYSSFNGDHSTMNGHYGVYVDFDFYGSFAGMQANKNEEAGYYFDGPHKDTITGNFANKNGDNDDPHDSGFYFDGSSSDIPALVSHNGSYNNTGWGFYNDMGGPTFLNGAGNQASSNGMGQCFGVNCP